MTDDERRGKNAAYMREWSRKNAERVNAERRERYSKKKEAPPPLPDRKVCSRCKRELPASEFYTNGITIRSACKECERARKNADKAENPDKYKVWQKAFRDAHPGYRADERREYYETNKDRWREYAQEKREVLNKSARERRRKNPDLFAKWKRDDWERHRDQYLESHREYYKANRDGIREKGRKYYEENAEAIREQIGKWQQANPEKYRAIRIASSQRRRARAKQARGNYRPGDIRYLLEKQKYLCACCEKDVRKSYSVDHVMPLALGGSHDPSNLQILCLSCNAAKGAKHPDQWAARSKKKKAVD